MFMTDEQSAELSQPGVGAFDNPAPFVASQFPTIFISPLLVVLPVRRYQLDATPFPSLSQWIGVVTPVCDHPFWLLPRPTFRPGDSNLFERGVRKRNFCRRGTFQPTSQRNTFTVSQYHPLCAFTTLGLADCIAPFLAGAKLPSRKASSHFNKPSASRAPSKVRQALSQIPSSSHCFSLRQHVDGEGYSSGRKRHAAPAAAPTECPRNTLGSQPTDGPGCPLCDVATATTARSTPTARRSTAS